MKWTKIDNTGYKSKLNLLKSQTPYQLFEIEQDASISEIKKAYRKKMNIYHPDKNSEFSRDYAEDISKIFNDAYTKLMKKVKK